MCIRDRYYYVPPKSPPISTDWDFGETDSPPDEREIQDSSGVNSETLPHHGQDSKEDNSISSSDSGPGSSSPEVNTLRSRMLKKRKADEMNPVQDEVKNNIRGPVFESLFREQVKRPKYSFNLDLIDGPFSPTLE